MFNRDAHGITIVNKIESYFIFCSLNENAV